MRPVKLVMCAFGPYPTKREIDFTKLNKYPLFLISGSTGGGKTSILDALSFALFYRATGGKRDFDEMRCEFASDKTDTEIRFDFILRGDTYSFRRYLQMKKRRDSDTYEPRTASECYRLQDGDFALLESKSASAVTRKAQELLHMTGVQFAQIAVLPQGEFLRLLRASSKEKGEILETLFSANLWRGITENVKSRAKKIKEEAMTLSARREEKLSGESISDMETVIVKNSEEEKEIDDKIEALDKDAVKIQNELETAINYERLKGAENEAEYGVRMKETQALKAMGSFLQAEEKKSKSEVYKKSLSDAESEITILKALKETLVQMRMQEDKISEKRNEISQLDMIIIQQSKKLEEITFRMERGEEYVMEVRRALEKIPEKKMELMTLSETNRRVKELDVIRMRITSLDKAISEKQAILKSKEVISKALTFKLRAMERAFKENSAAVLACDLEEDEPCPVCGSTSHPSLARGDIQKITYAELDDLQIRERSESEELHKLTAELSELLRRVKAEKADEQEKAQLLREVDAAALEREIKRLRIETQAEQDLIKKLGLAEQRFNSLRAEYESAKSLIGERDRERAASIAQEEEMREGLKQIRNQLRGRSPDAIEVCLAERQLLRKNLMREIEEIEKEYTEALSARSFAEAELNAAVEILEKARVELACVDKPGGSADAQRLKEKHLQVRRKIIELTQSRVRLSETNSALKKRVKEARQIESEMEAKRKEFEIVGKLSDMMSGAKYGRTPILLYVLGIMFDETVAYSNRYFDVMSRGRYQLKRRMGYGTTNSHTGLDIEVIDAVSSKPRSIETLSGGEQFMASLSLAFGLSEVVQSRSGSVELDAIFIDEGFGSLDPEALEMAMRALKMVQRETKAIGIISHVAELKERIPARIEVGRARDGGASIEICLP